MTSKILLSLLMCSIALVSCDDLIPLNKPTEKFNETGSNRRKKNLQTDSTTIDTNLVKPVVVKIPDTTQYYKCKYPDVVQKILLVKRTSIFEKEARDISFYSKNFLDVFDVEKTHKSILMYYDKIIDSSLIKISLKGKIDFSNISTGNSIIN